MGYTHYWTYRPDHPRYLQAWPASWTRPGRIIARVRRGGITLAGPHGRGLPVLATEQGIRFNGDAAVVGGLRLSPRHVLAHLRCLRAGSDTDRGGVTSHRYGAA